MFKKKRKIMMLNGNEIYVAKIDLKSLKLNL